ncbi:VanZ family protein [Couchioplanes caeruleus]|uniref:VanZ-like domain-containing protein n=2 Tax=Couchioplanes caeruleus TaxID=56438 RepID=A0A1K0GHD9_9ACTN|nr:VanZ family protein [Couchioplanes caeruleus]OJF11654.1 hypothetical protein BG844_25045 [Couchioplanes caeruleus subsp. caeruleus]ROP32270.1 VanZ like protein [Couchioplanes caeruleus]
MWRRATIGILLLYAAGVVAITIFPIRVRPASYWAGEPFMTMVHWIPGDVDAPSFTLNIIMFIPFGVLVPLLWPATDRLRATGLRALAASASIEGVQLVLGLTLGSRRTIDVNDLIANTAGALIGLLILRLAVPSAIHRASACPPTPRRRPARPAPQSRPGPGPDSSPSSSPGPVPSSGPVLSPGCDLSPGPGPGLESRSLSDD